MLRFITPFCFAALLSIIPAVADSLAEVQRSFTVCGKPIPPEIFDDFGDAMMSDSNPIVVAIDVLAAVDSNRYADPIRKDGAWITQVKPKSEGVNGPETIAYEYRGSTANGLMTVLATWSGGGSGTFYWLHILEAKPTSAFNDDGALYQRLELRLIRSHSLGDRWNGEVKISGNTIRIKTEGSRGGSRARLEIIEALRP